jgi:hypothetical protein
MRNSRIALAPQGRREEAVAAFGQAIVGQSSSDLRGHYFKASARLTWRRTRRVGRGANPIDRPNVRATIAAQDAFFTGVPRIRNDGM